LQWVTIAPQVYGGCEKSAMWHEMRINIENRSTLKSALRVSAAVLLPVLGSATMPTFLWAYTGPAAPLPGIGGFWARNSLEFEPPASGPGPLTNLNRRPDGTPGGAKVGDYSSPILKPAAAARVKALGETMLGGTVFPDPENQCMPWQVPNILRHMEIAILQEPDQVTLLYLQNHQVRRVRMNASHPASVKPSWFGDSVGRYEGDTLVVDTIGIKVMPLSMIDWYGTPFGESLHVVERYRLVGYETAKAAVEEHEKKNGRVPPEATGIFHDPAYTGQGLQLEFTVEDPAAFATPWSASVTYRRAGNSWNEDVCAENLRESVGPERKVPSADVPDF
jgi:hypothetical protein